MASTTEPGPVDFTRTSAPQPHPQRGRDVLARHPEIGALFGRNPWSAALVVGLVALQLTLARLLSGTSWVWVVVGAWLVGAFVSHALFVLLHECAHDLALPRRWQNVALAIVGDCALGFPSAITFRHYHLLHHAHQGEYELDGDLPGVHELRIVGRSRVRRLVWFMGLGFMVALRPLRVKAAKVLDVGIVVNVLAVAAVDVAVVWAWGPKALVFLMTATFFALGLHPVGGRWVQEHVETAPGQETYSYYGPLNRVALNVGYHNEHHDLPGVPWHRLPKVRAAAPEVYDSLVWYRSWTGLVVRYLTDPTLGPWKRVVRPDAPVADEIAA